MGGGGGEIMYKKKDYGGKYIEKQECGENYVEKQKNKIMGGNYVEKQDFGGNYVEKQDYGGNIGSSKWLTILFVNFKIISVFFMFGHYLRKYLFILCFLIILFIFFLR